MKLLKLVLVVVATLVVVSVAFVYGGVFSVAADEPHWGVTLRLMEAVRERSIATRARDSKPPSALDQPQLIAAGASEYAEMCTGCHLAPGMEDTEMRKGLYPLPPELSLQGRQRTASEQFWIIKHGLKMTGMPAWGRTHDDERIWSMVAFLQKLPGMTSAQYHQLVGSEAGGHSHGDTEGKSAGEQEKGHDHAEVDSGVNEQVADASSKKHSHGHATASDGSPKSSNPLSAEATEAAAVVDQFQRALAQGRKQEASALLDPNVLIFEGGGAERSREEYASHHLGSDAEFLKTANVATINRTGNVAGDLAWIATESRIKTAGAKALDLMTTETMILKRTGEGWRVTHIHWSSEAKK